MGRSPISLVSGSQGLHEASRRGDLHKLPPGTNSHFTDQHRTKICRAAVARELLSLDREATWNMLWTSWMGPSLVGGGSGFMRKARAGAGRGPGPGENYGFCFISINHYIPGLGRAQDGAGTALGQDLGPGPDPGLAPGIALGQGLGKMSCDECDVSTTCFFDEILWKLRIPCNISTTL